MARGLSTRNTSLSSSANPENGSSARFGALLAGLGIAALGLTRKSATRAAMVATGATIASFALREESTGTTRSVSAAESSIIVNAPRERVYSFWRDFQNLPLFMHHLKSVQVSDTRHSRWVAFGPFNKELQWDAEITGEVQNQQIAWKSIEGSDVDMEGLVEFSRATGDRGTLIKVNITYSSPSGALENAAAKIMGKDPSFLMRQDMRRFKALLETGELPTTEGQSHGPRSALSRVLGALDPDETVKKTAGRSQAQSSERRVS